LAQKLIHSGEPARLQAGGCRGGAELFRTAGGELLGGQA